MLKAFDESEIDELQYETLVSAIIANLEGLSPMDIEKILKTILAYWANTLSDGSYTNSKLDSVIKVKQINQ
jgi:hypothetical protein